ncbi:MAG: KpsF/GutQ family sugar-phosphate isomerase [Acidobacteriota bacterium]|jgi:arabinose-5-phosphate isomerase|nr:KpsF/GutQ family sugar-phosphate isomerase [Acidobacteriota bacterium]OQB56832.1 MAG: Arabinose 5-phosphate isomerase KdsD [Candidatus Aminicenantes bacterium ADurb.Bin147]HNQ81361.1 KpsF/GutQ family sugar-phosphate isomerase [Candidatus Aminicenantes bacterium]MDD8011269.1 KpsF/GutQ family sugar-phosphate isomerase [Acidobacteriota bacterium]MDD8030013.1 KpsF/GutQ family sugar-phosphate isomerase [Acidobacteriota bacterium]
MTKEDIIRAGRDVLDVEARAVARLRENIGEPFVRAVNLLYRTKTRVIILGMGKSGLVGRKIAATLASCGTPAIFVHPAEAGHGDLGMILEGDVVIAVSYSGETREIIDLLGYIKRLGVKLILITGAPRSHIARYSDIVLEARVSKEADPDGLVPTASSTAALALGDALAIAVMKRKGFTERDFASVHPKGALGKRLLRIETLMHKGRAVPRVGPSALMSEAIEEMTAKKLGMTSVVDEAGRLAGVITDGDLRRMIRKHGATLLSRTAGECMTTGPLTVTRTDLAAEALNVMEQNRITSLVVLAAGGKVEGIIHLHDLWRTEMF